MAETKMPEPNPGDQLREMFPGNSQKQREQRESLEPVVSQPAVRQEKTIGGKMKEAFIDQGAKNVGDHILNKVVIPAFKDMCRECVISSADAIRDTIAGAADMILYGERRPEKRYVGQSGYTNYNSMSRRPTRAETAPSRTVETRPLRTRYQKVLNDDIFFYDRKEAWRVVRELEAEVARHGFASLAEFYHLSKVPSDFTDEDWGWSDLSKAYVVPVGNQFRIMFPPIEPANDIPF